MIRTIRPALVAAALAAAAGCSLAEVATDPGADVVVVEAVLRTDQARQQVLLHRSLQGTFAGGVDFARVVVTGEDGRAHTFPQSSACYRVDPAYAESDSIDVSASCYVAAPADTGWLAPGKTYDLRVETPDGKVILGRTHVPRSFTVPSVRGVSDDGVKTCSLAPGTGFTLLWTRAEGTDSYVADLSISGLATHGIPAPEPFELRGLAISEEDTTIVLPAEFGVFERFNYDSDLFRAIEHGFPSGINLSLALAAADRNWVNSVRGGNFNPSGQLRISTVTGDGVGMFGSLVVQHIEIPVTQRADIVRCGK